MMAPLDPPPSFPPRERENPVERPSRRAEDAAVSSSHSPEPNPIRPSRPVSQEGHGPRRLSQRGVAPLSPARQDGTPSGHLPSSGNPPRSHQGSGSSHERPSPRHSALPLPPPPSSELNAPHADTRRSEEPRGVPHRAPAYPPRVPRRRSVVPPSRTREATPTDANSPETTHTPSPVFRQPPSFLPQRQFHTLRSSDTDTPYGTPPITQRPATAMRTQTQHQRTHATHPHASAASAPPRQAPRPRSRKRRLLPLLVLTALLIAWPLFLVTDANAHLGRTDGLSGAPDTPGTTFLLAGSDSREDGAVNDGTEGQRADSIMLVHLAPNGQASTVSLPRDTWVELPTGDWDKLNASYAYGGAPELVSTVETLSGLTIDHYVEIGMGGVGRIVDAVGGVELCYDADVNDEFSGLHWQAGCHLSDGTTALAFSRMRYSDPLGDIGRAQRQRQVVSQTIKTALSPSTLLNPVSAWRLGRAGSSALTVDQDTSVLDIGRLVLAIRQANNEGLTGTPPLDSLAYETPSGSAVRLVDDTAPDFFTALREGTLTPEAFTQELL